eukprot:CAMPEP_0197044178 /NCGR_PEP_ID=MMETSP1384-20130603/20306_1 /TAXON_ID=29189 /ORGANISM="Ammonia sp." /LENGTH=34 /DNA_ID= /DNA_START= /DNA_END= /DNA_ORIENTATION=
MIRCQGMTHFSDYATKHGVWLPDEMNAAVPMWLA